MLARQAVAIFPGANEVGRWSAVRQLGGDAPGETVRALVGSWNQSKALSRGTARLTVRTRGCAAANINLLPPGETVACRRRRQDPTR